MRPAINQKTILAVVSAILLQAVFPESGHSGVKPVDPGAPAAYLHAPGRGEEEPATSRMPLIINELVEQEISFFTTTGRDTFQRWLIRSAKYLPLIKKILREQELPDDLACLPLIESGFNVYAISSKNAVGPWQFMIKTAESYGLTSNGWIDERRDPIKSTRAAAAHLKDLYETFRSWPLALASYNAGAARVQKAIRSAGSSDFWDLRESNHIGDETRNYVPRYLAAMIISRDPAAYGFDVPDTAPFAYQEILLPGSTTLQSVADVIGSSLHELRELNPELTRPVTPPDSEGYFLRIPPGTRKRFVAAERNKISRSWLEEWALKKKSLQTALAPLQTELTKARKSPAAESAPSSAFKAPFPFPPIKASGPGPGIPLQALDLTSRPNMTAN